MSKRNFQTLDPYNRSGPVLPGASVGVALAEVKSVDVDHRRVTAIVSTGGVDRYGEIIEPRSFQKRLDRFARSPVMLAGHKHIGDNGQPTVIGSWSDLQVTDDGLVAVGKFANTKLADEYWELYRGGDMRAFSVGFIPHAHEYREFEIDGKKRKLRVFTDVELLEISAVAVPANADALIAASLVGDMHDHARVNIAEDDGGLPPRLLKAIDDAVRGATAVALAEAFASQLRDAVADAIETLSADPASPLCGLIQDVVQASRGCGDQGAGYDDDDVHPELTAAGESAVRDAEASPDELAALRALRDAVRRGNPAPPQPQPPKPGPR